MYNLEKRRHGFHLMLLFSTHPPPCIITHGHVDVKYAHYGLNFYNGDANHIVESFAKLLQDLEKTTNIFFSRALFKVPEQHHFMR